MNYTAIIGSLGALSVGAASLQAAVISPLLISTSGTWSNAAQGTDGKENTKAVAPIGGTAIYDLGVPTTFGDISFTSTNVNTAPNATPNKFTFEVSNDLSAWTTVTNQTDFFGYAMTSASDYNAGRRLQFNPVTARYIRYTNTNGTQAAFQEFQLGRPVVLMSSQNNPTSGARGLNTATDNDPVTTYRSTGTAGSFIFDALLPAGEGVKTITLQHADAGSSGPTFTFPKGTITVTDGNDPLNLTHTTTFTLNSTETAGTIYTLTYDTPVNSRYFQVEWTDVVTPTATSTQFAEVGITTSAIPEPAAITPLLGSAGLLLLRRRRA